MLLCEEYLKRHKLEVKNVKYANNSSLFFKPTNDRVSWLVLNIAWHDGKHGQTPGAFYFNVFRPQKYYGGEIFQKIEDMEKEVYWEKYEKYILDFAKSLDINDLLTDSTEVYLAAWELFLFSMDAKLTYSKLDSEILYQSVNLANSNDVRYRHVTKCLEFIYKENSQLYTVWRQEMYPHVANYAYWLIEVLKTKPLRNT